MSYSPHTEASRRQMLKTIGVSQFEDLIANIPAAARQSLPLDLPRGMAESDVQQLAESLAGNTVAAQRVVSFLGGGIYDHHIPAAVDHCASRSEFYTAYTPYQPEVAQGTLQATWEFQSMIRRLTAMDVAQASLYDAASAVAEAALLAMAHTNRRKIVIAGTLNPRYRAVLETYLQAQAVTMAEVTGRDGRADFAHLSETVGDDTACVIMQSPNYFGSIDDWSRAAEIAHAAGALLVAVFQPIALGLLKPPGECGADIAVGEGQPLGNPPSFGGPLLGLFAVRQAFIRRLPGRLVGRSVDARGVPAFVMTLQTREQHIRREKATSNICTAQALLATRAAIYMSLLGREGITELATVCTRRAHYLAEQIHKIDGARVPFGSEFFNEFVVETDRPVASILGNLRERGFLGGIDLSGHDPAAPQRFLVCVTEKHSPETLNAYVAALTECLRTHGDMPVADADVNRRETADAKGSVR